MRRWWRGGTAALLQNLDLITLPAANRPESLKEQLLQMAWAGELEGWLTAPPLWHLVADAPTAAEWEPALRAGLEQPVEVIAPVPVGGLAALTATRAAQAGLQANLLPAEFSTRYHQQFVDRLWMRGLGAVVALYLVGRAGLFRPARGGTLSHARRGAESGRPGPDLHQRHSAPATASRCSRTGRN